MKKAKKADMKVAKSMKKFDKLMKEGDETI